MAKQIIEKFTDDLDGSDAEGTTKFGLDGDHYEIDLSATNEETLRKALAPFINAARPVRAVRTTRLRRGSLPVRAMSREQSADIRRWAKDQGLPVSERGRIAASVVEKYEAAH
jgi:hypothetical protein